MKLEKRSRRREKRKRERERERYKRSKTRGTEENDGGRIANGRRGRGGIGREKRGYAFT